MGTYVRKNTGDNKQNYQNKRDNSRDKNYKGPKPAYKVLRDAKGEFDFEAMAANMNEMEQFKEEFNQNNEENYGGYAQDNFFDDISTSLENKGEDDDHYKQYEINNETFGFVNRRGRGRGGRGRGNYRGGYNNNRGGYNNNRG